MSGYDFHPEAYLDLDGIWEFIAEDNPDAADRVIADILAAIDALVPFPAQGHTRIDLTSRPLRFWRVRDYLIAYRVSRAALVGRCRAAWQPQSACHGRDSKGQGIDHHPQLPGIFRIAISPWLPCDANVECCLKKGDLSW